VVSWNARGEGLLSIKRLTRCMHVSEPRASNYETGLASECGRVEGFFLFEWRKGKQNFVRNSHKEECSTSLFIPLDCLQKDEVYLNLVLEFVPETVYRASRHYAKLKQVMPMLQVKLYMYQVCSSPNRISQHRRQAKPFCYPSLESI
jgi:hypothetical protein